MMNGKSKKIAWQDGRQNYKFDKVSRKASQKVKTKPNLQMNSELVSSASSTGSKVEVVVKAKEDVCFNVKP